MGIWDDYKREERPRLSPGSYRVTIVSAEERESKAGNPMIVIGIQPNGSSVIINHYIVKNQYFNRNMTDFFDSFNIEEGDFVLPSWIGAVGAAKLKEDDQGYLTVSYFISQDRADRLPPWEGTVPERQTVTSIGEFSAIEDEDDDLPF